MPGIQFLTNEAGKVEGLAYAGFETFKGSPYTSCARETGQNSRDAATGKGTVKVSFDLLRVDRAEVPFADELEHSIRCCLTAPQNSKTQTHLKRALAAITCEKVKVLRISDTNTTGLIGPVDDPESIFAALVKGDGITNKQEETSAGSFGIGKNAAFAVSELQTVVYSTCYADVKTGKQRFAAQGRIRLISHSDSGKKCSAEGYWGKPGFAAIENAADVPEWMARDVIGTSIHAIGFDERDHWAERIKLSLVTNFFAAIVREEIEFCVDGSAIDRDSIDSILKDEALEALAKEHDQIAELERARRLLLCIRSEAATRHTVTVPDLGDFILHLLVGEKLPREVHVLRNGIYITDNFSKFSQPMRQFPGTREFTAVLEPAASPGGRAPSALLKQLENPAHDAFEPDRITEEVEQKRARDQIKKLIKQVRQIIRSVAKIDQMQSSQLEELSAMFADPGATRDRGRHTKDDDPDTYVYRKPRRGLRRHAAGTDRKGQRQRQRQTRDSTDRSQRGSRTRKDKKRHQKVGAGPAVPLEAIRSAIREGDPLKRTVWFTPRMAGEIWLTIEASGLTDDVSLDVARASHGTVNNGRIRVTVRADERVQIEVLLTEPFAGPIELSATKFVEAAAQEAA